MKFFLGSQKTTKGTKSFFEKITMTLALMGIIPFLLVIYLFFTEKIAPSDMAVIFSALALFSILIGYILLRKAADQIADLARKTKFNNFKTLSEELKK